MMARLSPVVLLLLVCGCTGGGRIEFASLNFRAIDPPKPRIAPLRVDECYWWTDDQQRVWIAMQRKQGVPFVPKLSLDFQLSLRLDKLPAGHARNYKINRQTMRARVHFGAWYLRFTSTAGILAIYRESGDRLHGSMRLQALRYASRLIGGWGKPTRYLMLGSFTAVYNEQRGREIAVLAESDGWGRNPPRSKPPQDKPSGGGHNRVIKYGAAPV